MYYFLNLNKFFNEYFEANFFGKLNKILGKERVVVYFERWTERVDDNQQYPLHHHTKQKTAPL